MAVSHCYIQRPVLTHRTWPPGSLCTVDHPVLHNALSPADSMCTWFFPTSVVPLLALPLSPFSERWIDQGVCLWPPFSLHSSSRWPHPLFMVLNAMLIPPSKNVDLQIKTFSWVLDLNIQLPTSVLCLDVYEVSQTYIVQNWTLGLPHLALKLQPSSSQSTATPSFSVSGPESLFPNLSGNQEDFTSEWIQNLAIYCHVQFMAISFIQATISSHLD